jgi:hypothetical protein
MWAGIWIDGQIDDVAHYLRALADTYPEPAGKPTTITSPPPIGERGVMHRASPPPRVAAAAEFQSPRYAPAPGTTRREAVAAVITARASGQCELMTPHCRYTSDTQISRITGHHSCDAEHPASAYVACRPCQGAVAALQPQLARRLGYLVDPPTDPVTTPFFWRQRWVYLGGSRVIAVDDTSRAAIRPAV